MLDLTSGQVWMIIIAGFVLIAGIIWIKTGSKSPSEVKYDFDKNKSEQKEGGKEN